MTWLLGAGLWVVIVLLALILLKLIGIHEVLAYIMTEARLRGGDSK